MTAKDYKYESMSTADIQRVVNKIEDPKDPDGFHKFIDTAIYSSFKYLLRHQQDVD